MGYEVYCQAQLILIFTEDLTKCRDIDVLSEDVSHGQDKDIENVREKMYSDDDGGILDQMYMKNLSKRKASTIVTYFVMNSRVRCCSFNHNGKLDKIFFEEKYRLADENLNSPDILESKGENPKHKILCWSVFICIESFTLEVQ